MFVQIQGLRIKFRKGNFFPVQLFLRSDLFRFSKRLRLKQPLEAIQMQTSCLEESGNTTTTSTAAATTTETTVKQQQQQQQQQKQQ